MKRIGIVCFLLAVFVFLLLGGCWGGEQKKAPDSNSLPAKQETPKSLTLTKEGLYEMIIERFPSYTKGLGWEEENSPRAVEGCIEVKNGAIKEGPGLDWTVKVLSAGRDEQGKLKIELELISQDHYLDSGKPENRTVVRGIITEDHGDSWIMYGLLKGSIRKIRFKQDGSVEYDVHKDFISPVRLSST